MNKMALMVKIWRVQIKIKKTLPKHSFWQPKQWEYQI